ncbi:MAG: hypothetical protein AAF990_00160 [Bacteroidota bacterium]
MSAFVKTSIEFGLTLLFYGLLVALLIGYIGLADAEKQTIECGAERVVPHNGVAHFESNGAYFSGGKAQTQQQARSGNYSLELSGQMPYGMSYSIPTLRGNEKIKLSVWRYASNHKNKTGTLVASISGGLFWEGSDKVVETDENGWEKIELTIDPLLQFRGKHLRLYCWNPSQESIYFDDMHIEIEREEKL